MKQKTQDIPGKDMPRFKGKCGKTGPSVVFSDDESLLFTDKHVYDVNSGATLCKLPFVKNTNRVVPTPDGLRVAGVTTMGLLMLCDAKTGKVLGEAKRTDRSPAAVVASPDGSAFVAAASDGRLDIWNAADGSFARSIEMGKDVLPRNLWFMPDGKTLAVTGLVRMDPMANGAFVSFWDWPLGEAERFRVRLMPGYFVNLWPSPDGETAAEALDYPQGIRLVRLSGETLGETPCPEHQLRLSDMVWADPDRLVVWQWRRPEVVVFKREGNALAVERRIAAFEIGDVAVATKRSLVAVAYRDGVVHVWNREDYFATSGGEYPAGRPGEAPPRAAKGGQGGLRTDGIYRGGLGPDYYTFLRFVGDGTVHVMSLGTSDARKAAVSIAKKHAGVRMAALRVDGQKIAFDVDHSNGRVSYEGTLGDGWIKLRTHSHINGHKADEMYHFFEFKFAEGG